MGNKKDLQKNRLIDSTRGLNKAKKLTMNKFVEVSAKTKENLMETFKEFYLEIYRKNKKGERVWKSTTPLRLRRKSWRR